MALISFLLPTRGRPELARSFLRSLRDTAHRPEEVEVVLGVDEDDPPSHAIACEGLAVKTLILPPGLSMGALNRACFEVSTGRYVTLINDDVIVRTPGWDTAIYRTFARFDDDIALVHVNDLLFGRRLCTFPILSRKACLEIGVCPDCYHRYRIDDHVGDTYGLLARLGHERRVYLEDVVFEHQNYTIAHAVHGDADPCFRSPEGKVYRLEKAPFAADSQRFAATLDDRKGEACALARLIETAAMERRQAAYTDVLAKVQDPFDCRPAYGDPRPASPGAIGETAEAGGNSGSPARPPVATNHRRRTRGAAVRDRILAAWRRYQRLPMPVRRVFDPAASAFKRLLQPLVRPPEPIELGGKWSERKQARN